MSLLLLLVVLTFSKCKKGSDVVPFENQSDLTEAARGNGSIITGIKTINVGSAVSDGGFSYKVINIPGTSDSGNSPSVSTLQVFENGKALGPAHAMHADIRDKGKGLFSHWSGGLYFSASDNTDPRSNGRTYTYSLDGSGNSAITPPVTPPITNPEKPGSGTAAIGFASVDGKTTGGLGGQTVTVTSLSALKNAVESSSALIILVSGKITGTGYLNVKSNKTIQGLAGSSMEGVGLMIYGSNNVIVQNMTIRNVVTYSNIIIKEGAHHIWIDHCDLSSDRTHGWDYYDGLLDVGKRADYVTLSWNRLHDSHIPMLIGFGDENTDDIGHLRVTVNNNYFYNVSERQPSTRFGYIHVFNNYLQNGSGYGIGVTMGATVRTDNNYFENQAIPIFTEYNAKPGYVSGAETNIYANSKANRISTASSTWTPAYEYKSVLIAAANVPAVVSAGAGATLAR
ncbi:pectate lyase family protein [Pedobacter caeni]|uniref:Pectate lyase n=1 Tax=Pedobacter caeni TaxID=288992 RepID=A0A1M5GFP3_9SPHI|nr:pectate lyase [Pedobacter caeni]SHG02519.1 Pectate lyase [Pedobacter caeni]